MICINTEIPADICDIDDELKAIYHSRDTVCIWVFKTRQDRNNFMDKTAGMKKNERENYYLIGLLERRLDAVIYRAKFATTVFSSRQLINHGHVRVNGKKVNIGSYIVKEEDTIEIRDKSKQLAIIDIALASKERETPEYIQMDEKNKKVKFVRTPKFEEVPYPIVMEPNLVIEYYSR